MAEPLHDLRTLQAVMLDRAILIAAAVLTVSGGLAFYRNLSIGWSPLVFVNALITPALLWSLVLARRHLAYRWKAVLLILVLWGLALNALTMVGPVANAKAAIILNVLLGMLFLTPRAGWFNVAVGALILAAIGAAAVTGRLTFPIDYPNYVKTPAVWVQTVFSFIAYSAFTALIAARLLHSLDATVQALATQTAALREIQARLSTALDQQRAIFNNSSAGIARIDGTRTIVEANPRFCDLLGYRAADLVGQSTRLIHRDAAAFEAVAGRCYAPPGPAGAYSEDIQLRRRDGTLVWTHASLSPLDPAAPGAGAVLVLVDIDQRKQNELAQAFAKHRAESAEVGQVQDRRRAHRSGPGSSVGSGRAPGCYAAPRSISSGALPPHRTGRWSGTGGLAAMKFPYGLSDFGTLIQEGYWYQDRTDRIPQLEDAGRQLIFIRPRRFGKSLLLSMLEHYYDLNRADQFGALFGGLAIGRDPTPLHNRFFVMKWDFSLVQAQGEPGAIEAALHRHLNDRMTQCMADYASWWTRPIIICPDNAISSLESLLGAVRATPHKLYLFIDEYDNFANEVLMAGPGRSEGQKHYESLLYGEGLLKTIFKMVKAAAGGMGVDRVFITGVSPVVLSDMTSGYNVGENIYLDATFNDLCGFTEPEIATVLGALVGTGAADGGDWSPAAALETMRTFYNGYRFSEDGTESVYNPTLSLYFLKALSRQGQPPRQLLDENLAMDRNKLAYIARLPHGEDLLVAALSGDDQVVIPQLARRFGVEDMLRAVKDQPFMASLLYYFGVLTLAGVTPYNETLLKVPNLVARALYVERLRDSWLPDNEDRSRMVKVARHLCQTADPAPLCDFIESRLFRVLSNRDYLWTNELLVKFAFLTLLFDDRLYMAVSELETDRGFADLALIVRPDMRRFQALDLLLEFKYLGLKDLGLTGEQVRAESRETLAALPAVAARLDEAAEQARVYGATLRERHGLTDLRALAVVALGIERLVWRVL